MKRHLSEGTLRAARGRLGIRDNDTDHSRDEEIKAMPAREIVHLWFGWHMGYDGWDTDAIRVIEEAYGIKLKEPKL